ncbi:MAG: DUF4231 domain-containing protein [Sphingomonas bacterium]|nr:DUF4231 domain-containing protein [Sphingomonas bacterium]
MDMLSETATAARASQAPSDAPPKVPLTLVLGVTGHRPDMLDGERERIERRLSEIFDQMSGFVAQAAAEHAALFASAAPQFHLVSPLAEGADQMAARVALAKRFTLGAMLPFARDQYELDFAAGAPRDEFHALLAQATSVLELPGERATPLAAYVMAGRATIAHCDLLIAIWDGEPPRGRGGTGEVVEIALLQGTPILHLPIDPAAPVRLLWSGFDPQVCTTRENCHAAAVECSAAALETVIGALLLPPADPRERRFILDYYRERERRLHLRLEYPFLLALTGVSRIKRSSIRARPFHEALASEWQDFRASCGEGHGVTTAIDPLQRAYCWSDQLARHFAQTYRSGHVFNFLVGAAAVLTALAGLVLPEGKLLLATAELAMIAAVIVNTHVGVRNCWHRRWLDYRQLAERLRPMRSLKLLGVAAPRRDPNARLDEHRWTEWYAAGMWRAMSSPTGVIDETARLAAALTEHELAPQIAYHRHAAHLAESLDHRLHMIGLALFAATVIGCFVLIIGYFVSPEWVAANAKMFVIMSAGLPAVGTAIFGIRVQGDFAGTAQRSLSTAARLEASVAETSGASELMRAADLFEDAARAMLADLGEWQLSHQQRELVIPA